MIVLRGGTILTITRGTVHNGAVFIDNGKITAVGKDLPIPPGAEVIDTAGKIIMPGMIDCHTHLGIAEDGAGVEGDDKNEINHPVCPQLRALDAINPDDAGLHDALEGGITAVVVSPGSENVIGGQLVAMRTHGSVVDHMVLRQPAGLKVAFGENPKRIHGQQRQMPSTRMSIAAFIRENLVAAQNYLEERRRKARDPERPFRRNLALEALGMVLEGEIPLRAHAHRADDIMTAIRIADEFQVALTIEHATEGHRVAEELAKRNIPAIVGPSLTARVKVELKNRTYQTPAILAKAGVKIALMTDHPIVPVNSLRIEAALAIKAGLSEEEALKAVTINAAAIAGVGHRLGSLEPGKDADLIVLSGHPFDLTASVERVFVAGREVFRCREKS